MTETPEESSSAHAPTGVMEEPTIQPPKPLSFKGDLAENWKHFLQVCRNYTVITGLNTQTKEYKVALFLHCIGQEALKTYNGSCLKRLMTHIRSIRSLTSSKNLQRYKFNSKKQQQPEESTPTLRHCAI